MNLGTIPVHIPITGHPQVEGRTESQIPDISVFTKMVLNGDTRTIRGVYASGVMAFRVIQQPETKWEYVSAMARVVTQFMPATHTGVTGLIAHNFKAGESFFDLEEDQVIYIVYGNGRTQSYIVDEIFQYQALEPDNPYSDLINLKTEEMFSSSEVYTLHFTGTNQVTFQTCIAYDHELTWGRLFVTATYLETNSPIKVQYPIRWEMIL